MARADQYERYMLELINAERAKVGAPPLQLEQRLNDAAEAHSDWMLREDIFSHTGVGGSSPTQRMRDANFDFSGSWRTAENIAIQSERGPDGIMDDVANLHTSLMNSPGHRANILNADLDYIGIGIELGQFDFSSGTYTSVIVTQNFASTGGSVVLDQDPAPTEPEPAEEQQFNVVQAPEPVEEAPEPANEPVPVAAEPAPAPSAPETIAVSPPASTPQPAPASDLVTLYGGLDVDVIQFFDLDTSGPSQNADLNTLAIELCTNSLRDFQIQADTLADAGLDALAV